MSAKILIFIIIFSALAGFIAGGVLSNFLTPNLQKDYNFYSPETSSFGGEKDEKSALEGLSAPDDNGGALDGDGSFAPATSEEESDLSAPAGPENENADIFKEDLEMLTP